MCYGSSKLCLSCGKLCLCLVDICFGVFVYLKMCVGCFYLFVEEVEVLFVDWNEVFVYCYVCIGLNSGIENLYFCVVNLFMCCVNVWFGGIDMV